MCPRLQFCVLLLELIRPVGGLDKNSWEKLDTFYRNTNPVFKNRRLGLIADFLTAEMIKNELERANHFGKISRWPR